MRLFTWLERQPPTPLLGGTLLLTLLLGWLDYVTGIEMAFSVFYFVPVAIGGYLGGAWPGVVVAGLGTLTWLLADVLGGHTYSSEWIVAWNTMARLISFVVLALVMAALRRAYDHQLELAQSDPLTGTRNRRRFLEMLDQEINRTRRFGRAFTLVHFDLDGFKTVNDTLGHGEGDAVLLAVVVTTQRNLREIDMLARLGGDEFAALLPETDPEAARQAVAKLQRSLDDEMRGHGWPVTFSLGVLTCLAPPSDSHELLRLVDGLTYAAKSGGKNTAVFDVSTAPAHG